MTNVQADYKGKGILIMKAAVLRKFNSVEVEEVVSVGELTTGQVLVRMQAATICGAQLAEVDGSKGPDKYLPHLLGHEGCGVVLAVGPSVKHVKVDDRVVLHWRKGQGIEASAPVYRTATGERVGAGPVATFAEKAIVSENRCTVLKPNIPSEVASLFGCAVTTAFGLLNNEAQLKIGQSILVLGVGGVGINLVQGAKMIGGFPIVAVDQHEAKAKMARTFGASGYMIFDGGMRIPDVFDYADKICGIHQFDVVVDCTGNAGMINTGLAMTAAGGRLVLVGQPKANSALVFINARQHYVGKMILDSQGGLTNPSVDIPRYARLYDEGNAFYLEATITHRFPIDQINEAFECARSGKAIRVALEF